MAKTQKSKWRRAIMLLTTAMLALGLYIGKKVSKAIVRGQYTQCQGNQYNISTALELYATDFDDKYPRSLDHLTPKYLKVLPTCPASGSSYSYSTGDVGNNKDGEWESYFLVTCPGSAHVSVGSPPNYPQYDPIHHGMTGR